MAQSTEWNYLAIVNATIAVNNATRDEDYEIPTSLGLIDSLEDYTESSEQPKKPKIKHFTEGAPDAAAFFFNPSRR
jgi:hypothetical protein